MLGLGEKVKFPRISRFPWFQRNQTGQQLSYTKATSKSDTVTNKNNIEQQDATENNTKSYRQSS